MDELRAPDPRAAGAEAHRELVPERPRRRLAHAGDVQVFAQHRGRLDVEVVERHDAIEMFSAGEMGRARPDVLVGHLAADVVEPVDGVAGPVGVAEFFFGEEQHAAPLTVTLVEEVAPLVVGRNAQHRQRHACSLIGPFS